MNKQELIADLQKRGQETSFLVNLITLHHRNAARKLRGLYNLLNAGHEVRTGNAIDLLVIDGCSASWIVLEEWQKRYA